MNETTETAIVKDNIIKVKADKGYNKGLSTLCKLTDTGNGYIAKFPSHSNCFQDQYVCLDYDEAEYLYLALSKVFKD